MVIQESWCPRRGDIVWIEFDSARGHEQAGRRPALIVSPELYNRRVGLALVCPVTSMEKGYPFEIRIPGNLPISGVILSDQVKSIDWRERDVQHISRLPSYVLKEVLDKIAFLLS